MKLEIGYNHDFDIRYYQCDNAKISGIRILYLSDFHFNSKSGRQVDQIHFQVKKLCPDLILLGGDYVDSKKGLRFLEMMLDGFAGCRHIVAVAGNHDLRKLAIIQGIMEAHAVVWLLNESLLLPWGNKTIQIDSRIGAERSAAVDFAILCLHKPVDISVVNSQYQLAFAGHLHGCQFVFWQTTRGLYPGRWFYKLNRLSVNVGKTNYYISKGLGDTMPLRYNCRKDIILVDVSNTNLV